jgi:hypothetical protein
MRDATNILVTLVILVALAAVCTDGASAQSLSLTLAPDKANPPNPTMGNDLHFQSVITNTGDQPVEGLVAWISLVEVTPDHEQPMDLEDWSALKAVTGAKLAPGASLETDWPMRLIQQGDYRVVVSVTTRNQQAVKTSPTVEFHVMQKPMVQSSRILPVALGIPVFLIVWIAVRRWQAVHVARASKRHA